MTNNKNHLVVTPAPPPLQLKSMITKAITVITDLSKTIVTRIVIKKYTYYRYTYTRIQKYGTKSTFFSNVRINNSVFRIGAFYQN